MSEETTAAPNPDNTQYMEHLRRDSLFHYTPHPHQPRNINVVHAAEQKAAGINTSIAVGLTKSVGSMWTAYSFTVLAVIGLFAILGLLSPIVALLVAWTSQTLIQLVLLPVIMVGQNVLGHKQELQADEQYETTMKTYHDIEEIMKHLSAQDEEILQQTRMLIHLLQANGISPEQIFPSLANERDGKEGISPASPASA